MPLQDSLGIRLHDVRHSYATAALLAGVPGKVISERLGHATAAFTLQTYAHVIPGMDEDAANSVAALILDGHEPVDGAVRISVRTAPQEEDKKNWPGTKSQASGCSGGTAQICARPVDRRHSPVALDVCPGICHPFLMVGSNHVARTVGAGPPWAVET